jgi:hypothetical protein
VTGRQSIVDSIPGLGHLSNRRQLNSSRKGHQDSHASVQAVQAGRGPGGGTRRPRSAGLKHGRPGPGCAHPPQVWHIVPDIDKISDIEAKTSISLYSNSAPISCTTSKFLPSISLYPDIAIRYRTRYRIKLPHLIYIECPSPGTVEIEYRTRYPRSFFDIDAISNVQGLSFWSFLNVVREIVYDIDADIYF